MFVQKRPGSDARARRRACTTPDPAQRSYEHSAAGLRIHVERFGARVAVIHAIGEIDMVTVPELEEVLQHRLHSTLRAVVLDFSGVTFLSCGGASMIARERCYARLRGVALNVLSGRSYPVEAALRACGLTDMLVDPPGAPSELSGNVQR
jgi:anti-sigma B factor antagonist